MNTQNETLGNVVSENRPARDYGVAIGTTNEETPEPTVMEEESYVGNDGPEEPMAMASQVRGISINPLSSGYMVKVGCQSVAVEKTETLIDMLNKYLTDPADFERKWYSKDVRNRLENI